MIKKNDSSRNSTSLKNKKIKEEEKYVEKRKKQILRDSLMQEIALLSKPISTEPIKKHKVRPSKKLNDFESKIIFKDSNTNKTIKDQDESYYNSIAEPESEECDDFLEGKINNVDIPTAQQIYNENEIVINKDLLRMDEISLISRSLMRNGEIQLQREKMDIFYLQDEIISAIKSSLVTFIVGDTGCGKTTQIPQFLYENGFTEKGLIGITQPRRLSTVAISSRLNLEMNENISAFHIKYENNITDSTRIKVMTEGILIKEMAFDFLLTKYSIIILDEVHERSTNIDVLIGLLSKAIKLRFSQGNPLRLILMSATVDTNAFKHVLGDFNVVRINSKAHRVDVFYELKSSENYLSTIFEKIKSILASEKSVEEQRILTITGTKEIENTSSASILVFLPSKEDIYKLKNQLDLLNKKLIILPLHSGLSKFEQNKVFEIYKGYRKIVLATNIAETSITINDVVFVIDSGRVKRKFIDNTIVLYKIDFISKGSARQRMGRAGRTRPGVCYRIYTGDMYENFNDEDMPQILTESFDQWYLQLKNLGVKNVHKFSFITIPRQDAIRDAIETLITIGALSNQEEITKIGVYMCKFPILARYCRLLLEEDDLFYFRCIIASILNSGFDLKRTANTCKYYADSKSDLTVILKIFLEFLKSDKPKTFCRFLAISYESFEEIRKTSLYLMKIAGKNDFNTTFDSIVSERLIVLICKTFLDQVAVNFGNSYIFSDGEVYLSKDSIDTDAKFVIFDHIQCGESRSYLKYITVIPDSIIKI